MTPGENSLAPVCLAHSSKVGMRVGWGVRDEAGAKEQRRER